MAAADSIKHAMAAFLTLSMFVMIGNMIKTDHLDPFLETYTARVEEESPPNYQVLTVSKPSVVKTFSKQRRFSKEGDKKKSSSGYIFFTLIRGPEYHALQVANAVRVARFLGATLAIPDIRGTNSTNARPFGDVYDVDNFIASLEGVVQVDKTPPPLPRMSLGIPQTLTGDFIASEIKPAFENNHNALKIFTQIIPGGDLFPDKKKSINATSDAKRNDDDDDHRCLATFQSLRLCKDLQELTDSMVATLRGMSGTKNGHFVAVDLRTDALERSGACGSKRTRCYDAREIGEFLRTIGFDADTTIYLTQGGWNSNLMPLRNLFPNTVTKDTIIPPYDKAKFLTSTDRSDYEKIIDLHVCSRGDAFIPALPSSFYESVVAMRIANGNEWVLLPSRNTTSSSSSSPDKHISPYIAKKSHFAYTCFC